MIKLENGNEFEVPSTRYQGSKRKLVEWIYENVKHLQFSNVLDLFGGTGVVSYLFKQMEKSVTYNDYLKFNYVIGKAIIENDNVLLSKKDVEFLLTTNSSRRSDFVQNTFKEVYFTEVENIFIDNYVSNIHEFEKLYSGKTLEYKKALAFYALFQSCMMKRPFNLFHRKNLYIRENFINGSFGNKTSWEHPFEILIQRFVNEANNAVFSNGRENIAIQSDAFLFNNSKYDLVYIDPPYFNEKRNLVNSDYIRKYHFLEGLSNYDKWGEMIDYSTLNLRIKINGENNWWARKNELLNNFEILFQNFSDSTIVMSYKSPGIPSQDDIMYALKNYKKHVIVKKLKYTYALNKSNGNPKENIELLFIGI